REHYPAAMKETAEDDDRAAIARAASAAELVRPASAVADAKTPVVQERGKAVPPPAQRATPPEARQAAQKPAEHCLLDIDELLAQDDDKGAIARAVSAAEPVKPASAVADAKTPVVQERGKAVPPPARRATPPAARQAAPPAARRAAAKSAKHFRWDIDELLPEFAAVWPPTSEPTLPICTASKSERKPPKLTAPRGSEKAQRAPASAAAPSAKVSARSRPTPPLDKTRQSQTSRRVSNAPRVEPPE